MKQICAATCLAREHCQKHGNHLRQCRGAEAITDKNKLRCNQDVFMRLDENQEKLRKESA
jgi:hypothetical protein